MDISEFMPSKFQSVVLPNGLIGNLYGPVGTQNCFVLFLVFLFFWGGWGRGESYYFPINDLVLCI